MRIKSAAETSGHDCGNKWRATQDQNGDYTQKSLEECADKPVITGSAVEQYRKVCPGARTIVFCASVTHARHVVEEFQAAGYRFDLLVGQPVMSDAERTTVNKQLREGKLDGVCTVDLVSEGYDLPGLECCIMLRPTASLGLYLQQVGRIMRPAPGKTACYLLDHVGNVGSVINGHFVRKHGLPSEDRDWSLEGTKKSKVDSAGDDETFQPLVQCPKCFSVHPPGPACPVCGHVKPDQSRKIEQVDGELEQVTAEMVADLQRFQRRREQASCRTLEELQAYGALTGKHPSWSQHVWKARQRKAEARQKNQSFYQSKENQCL